jgi:sRNA-binding regulator protein Hfq
MTTTNLSASEDTSTRTIPVQKLTQADFDALSPARQAFIRDRIQAGQVKIVSANEIAAPMAKTMARPPQTTKVPPKKPAPASPPDGNSPKVETPPRKKIPRPDPSYRLIGKPVKLNLINGQVHHGTLAEVWQYEFILHAENREFGIMKHAVATIEVDTTPNPDTT